MTHLAIAGDCSPLRAGPGRLAAKAGGSEPWDGAPPPGGAPHEGYWLRPKKLARSGAGALISTTTESSIASRPCSTPLGCRQTSPGPMMNAVPPTVDFTLPLTT